MKFTVPVKTRNPLNGPQGRTRGAMLGAAARRKKERNAAKLCTIAAIPPGWLLLYGRGEAVLTRLSAGHLDGDGLQAALKSVRDGVADALHVDDGSQAVKWEYAQRKCKRGEFGVEVEIR